MNATVPLSLGSRIEIDPDTRQLDERTWLGGSPTRVLRLTPSGAAAWPELEGGVVRTHKAGLIARTLTDAGLAHPKPRSCAVTCTVVIPVRDRASELGRCLHAIGDGIDVVVVDDGSTRPDDIAAVAAAHGATFVKRESNGGPAAARNTGLKHVTTEVVVFVDSDTLPSREAIDALCAHFDDPLVAAVAPRIRPLSSPVVGTQRAIDRYSQVRSSLDLGARPARVVPGGRVSYVPTAVFAARRKALRLMASKGRVFDERLRFGEDVDLVWRLHAAGWRVRYDPSIEVHHDEPTSWASLLKRRYLYGTSAGPLGARHGSAVAPLVVHPVPAATVAAAVAGRRKLAVLGVVATAVQTRRAFARAGVPSSGVSRRAGEALAQTWLGAGRYLTQTASPLLLGALVAGAVPGAGRVAQRRALLSAGLVFAPAIVSWSERRPALDPVRFALAHTADEVAYGMGVWRGSLAATNARAVLPHVVITSLLKRRRSSVSNSTHDTRGSR